MTDRILSRETLQKLDKLVERVARKAGYTGHGGLSYEEHLQSGFERGKHSQRNSHSRRKPGTKSSRKDLAEEIRTYLRDGLTDLMKEGHSEKEALQITLDKFDEAELRPDFDGFLEAFDGFGIEEYTEEWYMVNGEVIGLFYAGFVFLGLTVGGFTGYLASRSLIDAAIGLAFGGCIGIGLGLFSHAAIVLLKRK